LSKQKGFTLVEVMVAVMILSGALILLSNSWGSAFARLQKANTSFKIAALLERKVTELELEYRNKSTDEIPEERADKFGEEFPEYSWKLTSKKLEFPDLSSILTGQEGGADELTLSVIKQLTETISKSVKEVTVTVIYTPPSGKPLLNSVTTYFVDFNKEVRMGMPTGG
jgi:general secretion pathway protein I